MRLNGEQLPEFCFTTIMNAEMEQHDYISLVPKQYTGKEIEARDYVELEDENEAMSFYEIIKGRLLNVNNWHQLAGVISARFQLVDTEGNKVDRFPQIGDYLRIDIPGPGSKEGDGFDWARVEEINEVNDGEIQSIGFCVRPSHNPLGDKSKTSHFYSDESTGSFIVTREKNRISSWIIDRNIKPNDEAESLTDKIRDVAVGMGAMGKFSEIQWQNLASGIIRKE